jgi:hypothetical protein
MTDDSTTTTTAPGDAAAPPADVSAKLLEEMRVRVDEAASDIERLTAELDERTHALDQLESVVDALLGATETPVVVAGPDRRVRAATRGTVELLGLEAPPLGKPLSAVVPDAVADAVTDLLDADREPPAGGDGRRSGTVSTGGYTVEVDEVAGGGVVLVLRPG